MFNIIGALISGLLVGLAARYFYPGTVNMSMTATMILGIGGALLVGTLTSLTNGKGLREGFNRVGCLGSLAGAMALIWIGRYYGWGI